MAEARYRSSGISVIVIIFIIGGITSSRSGPRCGTSGRYRSSRYRSGISYVENVERSVVAKLDVYIHPWLKEGVKYFSVMINMCLTTIDSCTRF